jgi:hypothetical protein
MVARKRSVGTKEFFGEPGRLIQSIWGLAVRAIALTRGTGRPGDCAYARFATALLPLAASRGFFVFYISKATSGLSGQIIDSAGFS